MKDAMLEGINITKQFTKGAQFVLDHVNLTLNTGDFTVIMGASGAGKSTLLYALSKMDAISKGNIIFQGEDYFKPF